MLKLVLLRHGESEWNLENRFTGWTDVDLSAHGIAEAHNAGVLLKGNGYCFDKTLTSMLKRAIRTLWISLMNWISCGYLYIISGDLTNGTTERSRVWTSRK